MWPPDGYVGGFWLAKDWSMPSERALLIDSQTPTLSVSRWPYWDAADPAPFIPHAERYSIDFRRHQGKSTSADTTSRAVNVLFCDGHVDVRSPADAFNAVLLPAD